MVLYRKSKYFVFLLWAISVFLLCAGSLINFHQYKIWGKPLNFEVVAVKRESGKSVIKVTSASGSLGDLSLSPMLIAENNFICTSSCTKSFISVNTVNLSGFTDTPPSGLRAPPIVL